MTAGQELGRLIRREGPISFSRFMEFALYDPAHGFFAAGAGAGRAGSDFMTSPEVGPLFGACVARALDGWWRELGEPDPFVVVEAGAGRGRLACDVRRADPDCVAALHYVLVERSAALRALQRELLTLEPADEVLGPYLAGDEDEPTSPAPGRGPIFASLPDLPARVSGVVLANELLDNLPFDVVEFDGERWNEVLIGIVGDRFVEVQVPSGHESEITAAPGERLPVAVGIASWLDECSAALRRGRLAVVDYGVPTAELAQRSPHWLRTYRSHSRGGDPLVDPGSADITADVAIDAVVAAAAGRGLALVSETSQAEWLASLGIGDLVEAGRRVWQERAQIGDLLAIEGRSRAVEAAALTDPVGLGAHRVRVPEVASR